MFPSFGLRLLDAAGCTNATSTGLTEALPHFPDLVSLDLSRTPAAKDQVVLSKLGHLCNLRVLSLRGLGLKDTDFSIVAQSIGTRVRSLDVSNNNLTDSSAQLLLEHCMKETVIQPHVSRGPLAPVEVGGPNEDANAFEFENLVDHLRQKLTTGFMARLSVEEDRGVGVTHLYLTNNAMTIEGVSGLLRSGRLQMLDIGELPVATISPSNRSSDDEGASLRLPSVSELTPILATYASKKLKYLRIDYRLVTDDALAETAPSCRAELDGDIGSYRPSNAHELAANTRPMPELDSIDPAVAELSSNQFPLAELPGSSTSHLALAFARNGHASTGEHAMRRPKIQIISQSYETDNGITSVPKSPTANSPPASPLHHSDEKIQPAQNLCTMNRGLSPGIISLTQDLGGVLHTSPGLRPRHDSTHYTEDRRARLDLRQSQENRLHPNMLPHVHTLVLTNVPTATSDKEVVSRIIQYVKDAAEEALIARQRSRHTYILPPGRSRAIAEYEYAHSVFALQRIVLEMAPPQATPKKVSTSWRAYPTKSSTEDADSEAFWEAATHDFSFFGDEECGLPNFEPGRTLPIAAMSGLELAPCHPAPLPEPHHEIPLNRTWDVVGEVGKFRKERKIAYAKIAPKGDDDVEVEGYWPGAITVVRRPANTDTGELDCYGNRYESGWYYR